MHKRVGNNINNEKATPFTVGIIRNKLTGKNKI